MRKFKGPLSKKRYGGRSRRSFGAGGFRGFSQIRTPGLGVSRFRGASVFTMSFDQMKSYFFRRSEWERILNTPTLNALHLAAYILRVSARSEVRNRKNPSRPGRGPTNWNDTLKRGRYGILSGVDEQNLTVYVGPGKLPYKGAPYKILNRPTVPSLLEFGGKIWFKYPAQANPPRIRTDQPARRTRRIAPRPYMSTAWKKKQKRIFKLWENLLGHPGVTATVNQLNSAKGGSKK